MMRVRCIEKALHGGLLLMAVRLGTRDESVYRAAIWAAYLSSF
jgi:hypothetical protein